VVGKGWPRGLSSGKHVARPSESLVAFSAATWSIGGVTNTKSIAQNEGTCPSPVEIGVSDGGKKAIDRSGCWRYLIASTRKGDLVHEWNTTRHARV